MRNSRFHSNGNHVRPILLLFALPDSSSVDLVAHLVTVMGDMPSAEKTSNVNDRHQYLQCILGRLVAQIPHDCNPDLYSENDI